MAAGGLWAADMLHKSRTLAKTVRWATGAPLTMAPWPTGVRQGVWAWWCWLLRACDELSAYGRQIRVSRRFLAGVLCHRGVPRDAAQPRLKRCRAFAGMRLAMLQASREHVRLANSAMDEVLGRQARCCRLRLPLGELVPTIMLSALQARIGERMSGCMAGPPTGEHAPRC